MSVATGRHEAPAGAPAPSVLGVRSPAWVFADAMRAGGYVAADGFIATLGPTQVEIGYGRLGPGASRRWAKSRFRRAELPWLQELAGAFAPPLSLSVIDVHFPAACAAADAERESVGSAASPDRLAALANGLLAALGARWDGIGEQLRADARPGIEPRLTASLDLATGRAWTNVQWTETHSSKLADLDARAAIDAFRAAVPGFVGTAASIRLTFGVELSSAHARLGIRRAAGGGAASPRENHA